MYISNLEILPNKFVKLLKQIGELAENNDCRAFVVGGVVRDILLNRQNLDFDIVVEGDGLDFAKKLSRKLKAQLVQHERFYTSTLTIKNNLKIDIATARAEFYEHPGALPAVTPGKIEDDLSRRDFSINAMAFDLNPGNFGHLLDCFDGLGDLKNKKIRVLHELSFIDDPTRILRAIRFEQRFKFKIEDDTFKLIKQALAKKCFDTVKPPRIWQELVLILKENKPKKYILRLSKVSSLDFISSKLKVDKETIMLFDSMDKILKLYNDKYPKQEQPQKWFMYFMALIEELKLSEIKDILDKFNLSKKDRDKIYSYKNINKNLIDFLERDNLKPSQIYIVLEPLSTEAIVLLRLKLKNKIAKKRIDEFLNVYSQINLRINGDDINELGVKLDNRFKEILDKVFYKKIDGELKSKYDELEYAKELIEQL